MGDDESPCQSVKMEERVVLNCPSLEISVFHILNSHCGPKSG